MAAHVVPRPAEESALGDAGDVVGDEVIAEVVALVDRAPELACGRIDGLAYAVTDAVGVDLDELAFGRVFEDIGAVELAWVRVRVVDVRAGAYGDEQVPAVFGEDDVARPMAAAAQLSVAGNVRDDGFSRAGGVKISHAIGKPLDGRGVADVNPLGCGSRIEGNAEGMVEAGGKLFYGSGLAVSASAAQHVDDAGLRVGKEEVAVGRGANQAWHDKCAGGGQVRFAPVFRTLHRRRVAARVERDLETSRGNRPCVGRAGDHLWPVVDRLGGIGLGKVGERDLVADARSLLAPVGECGLAGEGGGLGTHLES